jgi:pimeloyl-ACP methyl ester carboxylesterase
MRKPVLKPRPTLSGTAGMAFLSFVCLLLNANSAVAQIKQPPPAIDGKKGEWHGFPSVELEVNGKSVLIVQPFETSFTEKYPWVWHGEFFGHRPQPDIELLKRGFHLVYTRYPDMLGCPEAVAHWDKVYAELTAQHKFASKVALVGLSRGGLYCYNWAVKNSDKVACVYADAAVCDLKSWPGGKGVGKGSPRDWELAMKCYGFKSEEEALAYRGNPVDTLEALARYRVPLLHVYGDADDVVPWEENTGVVAERYRALGGSIVLIAKPGVNHHPHGLEDSTPIVQFIERHVLNQFKK